MVKKFKTLKKFPLDFLGEDWKEAYINFERVTIKDVQEVFPQFGQVDGEDEKKVLAGIKNIVKFLEGKFVNGKAVVEDGKLVDLDVKDLGDLPAEVLSRALDFLSQGVTPPSPKP